VVYTFACVSVCMSVRRQLSKALTYEVHIFAHLVYLHRIQVKFVYEGHRIKIKVTEAKQV